MIYPYFFTSFGPIEAVIFCLGDLYHILTLTYSNFGRIVPRSDSDVQLLSTVTSWDKYVKSVVPRRLVLSAANRLQLVLSALHYFLLYMCAFVWKRLNCGFLFF